MAAAVAASRGAATRWMLLGAYALLAASTQLLWLSFAPIDTRVAPLLGTDSGTVGDLAAAFPLLYVVLALPTGRWLDHRFTHALSAGALLTAGGALIRLAAPASLGCQVAGQAVIACGQPLVGNSITKIAARNFPQAERATAIAIGTVALFAGILTAVLAGGPLFDAGGLSLVLLVEAVPAVLGCVLMLAALRIPPAYPDEAPAGGLRWLLHDRFLWLLAGLIFVGMGTFNAVATWLEPILDHWNLGGAAGNLVAVMTGAGIAGAALLAPAAAARERRRLVLFAALAVSVVAPVAIALVHSVIWIGGWLLVDGFVLMAALPVVLDWSETHAGAERQGAATGFLLMAGNLGGLVLVLAGQAVIDTAWLPLAVLSVAALVALPLVGRLPAR